MFSLQPLRHTSTLPSSPLRRGVIHGLQSDDSRPSRPRHGTGRSTAKLLFAARVTSATRDPNRASNLKLWELHPPDIRLVRRASEASLGYWLRPPVPLTDDPRGFRAAPCDIFDVAGLYERAGRGR